MKNKDVVIDADSILYTIASEPAKAFTSTLAGQSVNKVNMKKDLKRLKRAFKDTIEESTKIAEVESITHKWGIGDTIVVISDESNFRYDIYPEYKANRKGRPMTDQFKALRKWARKKYAPKMNIEADDMVAHLVRKGAIGFSIDKDLLKGVAGLWFDAYHSRRHWVTTSDADARRFNLIQYVMGDLTDNIKGLVGVGEVGAIKLLDKHGWSWSGVLHSYYEKGQSSDDAILTRRLISMEQFNGKKVKLFKKEK